MWLWNVGFRCFENFGQPHWMGYFLFCSSFPKPFRNQMVSSIFDWLGNWLTNYTDATLFIIKDMKAERGDEPEVRRIFHVVHNYPNQSMICVAEKLLLWHNNLYCYWTQKTEGEMLSKGASKPDLVQRTNNHAPLWHGWLMRTRSRRRVVLVGVHCQRQHVGRVLFAPFKPVVPRSLFQCQVPICRLVRVTRNVTATDHGKSVLFTHLNLIYLFVQIEPLVLLPYSKSYKISRLWTENCLSAPWNHSSTRYRRWMLHWNLCPLWICIHDKLIQLSCDQSNFC